LAQIRPAPWAGRRSGHPGRWRGTPTGRPHGPHRSRSLTASLPIGRQLGALLVVTRLAGTGRRRLHRPMNAPGLHPRRPVRPGRNRLAAIYGPVTGLARSLVVAERAASRPPISSPNQESPMQGRRAAGGEHRGRVSADPPSCAGRDLQEVGGASRPWCRNHGAAN